MRVTQLARDRVQYPALMQQGELLQQEIDRLRSRLFELVGQSKGEEKVIELREIPREKAKKEIKALFSTGRTLYYSDIAMELGLDLELVVGICNELQETGEIAIDARVP